MSLATQTWDALGEAPRAPLTDPVRTSEDHEVWRIMLDRIGAIASRSCWHPELYRKGLRQLLAWREQVPGVDDINDWLEPTGWRVTFVDGYVPVTLYQQLQSELVFPISWRLRRLRDLDHSAAPDFVHDILGHLPMLFDPNYSALVQEWAERGLEAEPTLADEEVARGLAALIDARERDVLDEAEVAECTERLVLAHRIAVSQPSRRLKLETFYTWAVEFGFVESASGALTLIGAAALSSPGEMSRIFSGAVTFRPFLEEAVGRPVDYTRYQQTMFVARSFEDYFMALRRI